MEDDPVSGNALSAILRHRGYQVTVASTLADGFAKLSENPGYVILDLMLPDGDGAELLRFIRHHGTAARVVVTTAVNDDNRLRAVHDLRPDAVLQKPINLAKLFHLLDPAN